MYWLGKTLAISEAIRIVCIDRVALRVLDHEGASSDSIQ